MSISDSIFETGEQLGLFVEPGSGDFRVAEHVPVPPSEGVNVRIDSRRLAIEAVLSELGNRSMRGGFQRAVGDGVELYDGNEEQVMAVNGAIDNDRVPQEVRMKRAFAAAWGLEPLINLWRNADHLSQQEKEDGIEALRQSARSDFERFLPFFEGAQGSENRDLLKKYLRYQQRTMNQQRTRKPKEDFPEAWGGTLRTS